MPIDNLDEFASTGTKTEPSTAQKARGWVGGEQVAGDQHNWWMNDITNTTNDIMAEGIDLAYPDAASTRAALTTGLWGLDNESWAFTDDTYNTISGGSGKAYVGLNVYFTAAGDPRLVALHSASNANQLDIYNPRTLASVTNSGTLTGLPSGGGQTWVAYDFCLWTDSSDDETYAFVVFYDTSNTTWQVQAYKVSDWTVKSGWAATGTALTGTGAGTLGPKPTEIIVASATKIALACPWNAYSTGAMVSTLTIAAGTLDEGVGSAFNHAGTEPYSGICSDGTTITFFSYNGSTGNDEVNTALVADCSAGSIAYDAGNNVLPYSLLSPDLGVIIAGFGNIGNVANSTNVLVGTTSNFPSDGLANGTDATAVIKRQTPVGNSCGASMVFDGLNIWIRGLTAFESSITYGHALYKVPAAKFMLDQIDANIFPNFVDDAECFLMAPRDAVVTAAVPLIDLVYDGRDIWMTLNHAASGLHSGEIVRLPRANSR